MARDNEIGGWSPVRLRTSLKTRLEQEAKRMESARELGHYQDVPYSDRHGFCLNSVVESLLRERDEHRARAAKRVQKAEKTVQERLEEYSRKV